MHKGFLHGKRNAIITTDNSTLTHNFLLPLFLPQTLARKLVKLSNGMQRLGSQFTRLVASPQATHKGSSAPTFRLRPGPQLLFVNRKQELSEQINTLRGCRDERASKASAGAPLGARTLWLVRKDALRYHEKGFELLKAL